MKKMGNNRDLKKIQFELNKIKTRYRERYGAVIFDVKTIFLRNSIILEGLVLSEKQKNEVSLTVNEIVKNDKIKIKNNINVLSDPHRKLEIGWGVISADKADLWSRLSDGKKIAGIFLASQAGKGDFVRILGTANSWVLAQTADLAIGWIQCDQVKISKRNVIKKEWSKIRRIKKGEVIKKRLTKKIQYRFNDFLKKYINVPYLLGGMSDEGIDCSGLVEKFYMDIFGILLPRHSGDQAVCGKEIKLGAAHFGDLAYLRHKIKKLAHICVIVEKMEESKIKRADFNNVLILNARSEKNAVLVEDLSEVLKTYNLISVNRIIKEI